ncbi:LOW QUALITY PROTEIN: senescence-associated carboxylesterase 101-like [Mangifera indica]|uniref:LOW QUALITY PROTEIN: senescence-associated carboxylesterase 101-like n=1 Tax=Mangifera indica TaxID=29780 RepID=UPI001CFABFD7|nr:LOW QUALITY PROTEIN: senescence-associated carboxylesterase 101-like [Mangifera indica]
MVAEAKRKPQTEEAAFMTQSLHGGTNYHRMVEPLDIAEYYNKGLRGYKTKGRYKHFIRLEHCEEYVMQQMKNYAVSLEVFLAGSSCSFMQWWREYEEVIGFLTSQLTHSMKKGLYYQYGNGS